MKQIKSALSPGRASKAASLDAAATGAGARATVPEPLPSPSASSSSPSTERGSVSVSVSGPQQQQRGKTKESIDLANDVREVLAAAAADAAQDGDKGGARKVPAPFASLLPSPRKASLSPGRSSASGSRPASGSLLGLTANLTIAFSGLGSSQTTDAGHGSRRGTTASSSPRASVSPTPAPTPADTHAPPPQATPTATVKATLAIPAGMAAPLPSPSPTSASASAFSSSLVAGTPPRSSARSPKKADGLWGLLGKKAAADSAVHEAARTGDLPLIRALMVQDPGIAAAPGDGAVTPLMLAAGGGQVEVVQFLAADARVDVAARDAARRTALHHLALGPGGKDRAACSEIVAACAKAAAGGGSSSGSRGAAALLDAQDGEKGQTALHYAVALGLADLVRVLLLKHGASPLVLDRDGRDPLALAREVGARPEIVHLLEDAKARATAKAQAEAGAGSLPIPRQLSSSGGSNHSGHSEVARSGSSGSSSSGSGLTALVGACVARLCGEHAAGGDPSVDEDEVEVAQPLEHQLAPVFRRSGIAPEAAEVYMHNLRAHGFDNLLALNHLIAGDRFKMALSKYVPDKKDRKRLTQALDEDGAPPEPALHLPVVEYLRQLLSCADDTALRYAEALRSGANVHTGQQLVQSAFETVEPSLVAVGVLQGHRKAVKCLLRQARAAEQHQHRHQHAAAAGRK